MSKFYSKYCENNKCYKPVWLEKEEQSNKRHKMHIMQAKMTTFGNHTGSKPKKVLMYHIHKIDKNNKSLYRYFS